MNSSRMASQSMQRKPVVYIGSQELARISSLLPSNKKRSIIVHSLVNSLGLMANNPSRRRKIQVVTPRRATYKDLAIYHTRDYLDFVLDAGKLDSTAADSIDMMNPEFGLEDDCPPFPELAQYVQMIGGATLTAVSALQQDLTDVAICWDGGRHHARKSQASGFCYVADCILAILVLKRNIPRNLSDSPNAQRPTLLQKTRIMYLDLDLHFSDAVSEAFYLPKSSSIPQILTLSIHHAAPGFFPTSERSQLPDVRSPEFDPFTLSIPLRQGASNATFATIWPIVEQVKDTFKPDYVVVQCGVDGLAGDPCAIFNWSLGETEGSLGWCVERITQWAGKKLLLGGGGYNSPNAARAWSYLTSIALETPLSLTTEIPDHAGFPLYGPSFTLDVPAGNMFDRNSQEYLDSIKSRFDEILVALHDRLNP